MNDHLSRTAVTNRFKRPTWERIGQIHMFPIWSCFGWGLHGYRCYQRHGSLLHCLSTLTTYVAVYFCCTGLGVTSTGRYPASCPVKPGLSSPVLIRPRSFSLLINFYTLKQLPPINSLVIELIGITSGHIPMK